jgi:hypothetical protein
MSIIYRKTAKGVHEIETREFRLTPRVRNALILVDGKRDVVALQALMPQQVDGTLQTLLEQNFIEVIGETLESPPGRAAAEARSRIGAAPVAPPSPPVAIAPPTISAVPFAQRQKAAVRDLNEAVGPMAESLAIRMERARDDADLRALVQMAVQLISNARGRSAAESYAQRHAG